MRRFLRNLAHGTRPTAKIRATARGPRRAALGVEALESRQLMSASPLLLHLPLPLLDPIQAKYLALGAASGVLGKSVTGEMATPYGGGLYEKFQNGAIFYSASTGAHDVLLPTEAEYFATAGETDAGGNVVEKLLGLPTTDQGKDPFVLGASVTTFQGGKIYWSSKTGAHDVYGLIGAEYAATTSRKDAGGRIVQTVLGLPTSDEMNVSGIAGARMNTFQGGAIYWSPKTGAHDVYGQIWGEYLATASEKDYYGNSVQKILGLPTSDEMNVSGVAGARMNTFQGGDIYWSSKTGAHVLYGAILAKYDSKGGATYFGLPTDDETPTPDTAGRFNHFATSGGALAAIDWTPWTGAHAVTGAIAARFAALGWEKIGEAVTDEIDIANFTYFGSYNRFQTMLPLGLPWLPYVVTGRSAIDWTKATGAYLTHGPQYSDIQQGNSGTCWIDASIAALENSGVDFSQRIQYQGNNTYTVSLYDFNDPSNRQGGGMYPLTETVYFDGATYGADLHWNPSDPAQSWALIMQRAVIQAVAVWDPSQSIQNPHSGTADDALSILTGRTTAWVGTGDQNSVMSGLAAGKAVVLCTKGTTSTLVGGHCYAVLSANSQGVTLYNPWGSSITVSWSVVSQDGNAFAVC